MGSKKQRHKEKPRIDIMELMEALGPLPGPDANDQTIEDLLQDPEYQEDVLTNADLAQDPPGHKSGYAALIGRPNAGKSTLLNALVGEKLSIVSPKAQTTRQRVLAFCSHRDYQLILLDTPGVVDQKRNRLEGKMMGAVKSAMRDADSIVALVDVTHGREELLEMLQPPAQREGPPMLIVLNKIDLVSEGEAEEAKAWWKQNCRCEAVMTMSALEGRGVSAVKDWMVEQLPEGPTLYPKRLVSQHPERFFISEIVREHVFRRYSQEIPYSIQVNIEEMIERKKGKHYIMCELVCERKGQQGILVGARGSAIKALASAARVDIEEFLGRGVFLEMNVRTDEAWRQDNKKLKGYGY